MKGKLEFIGLWCLYNTLVIYYMITDITLPSSQTVDTSSNYQSSANFECHYLIKSSQFFHEHSTLGTALPNEDLVLVSDVSLQGHNLESEL